MHLKDKIAIVTGGSAELVKNLFKICFAGSKLVINYIGDKTQAGRYKSGMRKVRSESSVK